MIGSSTRSTSQPKISARCSSRSLRKISKTIRIDVSDALYRHTFMAEGAPAADAATGANAMGALWLAEHQDIIDACPVKPEVVRWGQWLQHVDFADTHAGFERAYLARGTGAHMATTTCRRQPRL
jgi:hypothetical protein